MSSNQFSGTEIESLRGELESADTHHPGGHVVTVLREDLRALLTPAPDAAVREAVERLSRFDYRWGRDLGTTAVRVDDLRTILRAVRQPRLTGEQVEAVDTIINSDNPVCRSCEGEGNRYADGKAHYYSEHAPTIPCPECYGVGRIPELTANDMKEILRAEFPELAGEVGRG